jgi:hypothetical protein
MHFSNLPHHPTSYNPQSIIYRLNRNIYHNNHRRPHQAAFADQLSVPCLIATGQPSPHDLGHTVAAPQAAVLGPKAVVSAWVYQWRVAQVEFLVPLLADLADPLDDPRMGCPKLPDLYV